MLYLILFLILITSLISNIQFSSAPISSYGDRFNDIINFKISDHNKLLFEIINSIPKNSTLAVDTLLCPQSSNMKKVYFLHDYVENRGYLYKNETVDYILFDKTMKSLITEVEDKLLKILSNEFIVHNHTGEIFLYKHK